MAASSRIRRSPAGLTPGNWTFRAGGSYELLGIRRKSYANQGGEKIVATFRLILAGSRGVTYHDYVFDGPVKGDSSTADDTANNAPATVVDIYDYQSGEMLSEALRRDFILTDGDASTGGYSPSEHVLAADRENIKAFQQAFRDGSYAQCLDIYSKLLKPATKADPSVAILWLRAAGSLGFREFAGAYTALTDQKIPPVRKSAVWLVSIDQWVRFGDYQRVKECVDGLDTTFGRDDKSQKPARDCYLNVLRASIAMRQGDVKMAQSNLETVLEHASERICSLGQIAAYQAFELWRELSRNQFAVDGATNTAAQKAVDTWKLKEAYSPQQRNDAMLQYNAKIEQARQSANRPLE